MEEKWLDWARRLQAISQIGLTYAENPFDIERYEMIGTISAEILAEQTGIGVNEIIDIFSSDSGYATPKVDVRGACFWDNKILLVQERLDGRWTLPGGWADIGSSPKENVEREIFEESGFLAQAIKLVAIYDRNKHPHVPIYPHHIYKLFFLCEIIGGEKTTSYETTAVDFFELDHLPELSIGKDTHEQIRRMFEYHQDQSLASDFD